MYILFISLLIISSPLIAQPVESYVYGENQCYYFTAPPGWVADNQAGEQFDFPIVLYPQNNSWNNATTVIYTTSILKTKNEEKPADIVHNVLKRLHTVLRSPNAKAVKVGSVKSDSGISAPIYKYTGDRNGNTEYVSYFEADKTVNIFVMTSQDKNDIENSKPAFLLLSKSYRESNDCIPCNQKIQSCSIK